MRKITTIVTVLYAIFYCNILTSCNVKKQKDFNKKSTLKSFDNKNEFAYLDNINDPNFLVSLLDNTNDLESARIGIEGKRSQSYPIFERLCVISSDTTLVRLTNHINPKIRVYSMWALIKKNKQLALTQMELLKNDKATIVYKSGCINIPEKVNWLIALKFDSSEMVLEPK